MGDIYAFFVVPNIFTLYPKNFKRHHEMRFDVLAKGNIVLK